MTAKSLAIDCVALPGRGRCVVYYIFDNQKGWIKIGTTTALAGRFAALKRQYGDHLSIEGWHDGGFEVEEALHAMFAESRIEGEWFHATGELLNIARAPKLPAQIISETTSRLADGPNALRGARPMRIAVPTIVPSQCGNSEPYFATMRSAIGFMLLHEGNVSGGVSHAIGRVAEILGLPPDTVHRVWYSQYKGDMPGHIFDRFEVRFQAYLGTLADRATRFASLIQQARGEWSARVLRIPNRRQLAGSSYSEEDFTLLRSGNMDHRQGGED